MPRKRNLYKSSPIPESTIQRAVVIYLRQHFDGLFYHVPNEGKRNQIWAHQQGLVAGVSDLCLHWWDKQNNMPRTGYIELKRDGKGFGTKQQEWADKLHAIGIECELATSVEQVRDILIKWGAPINKMLLPTRFH